MTPEWPGAPGAGDRYSILASGAASDLPRLVLKCDGAFLVADRRGDFPALPGSEFGFYVDDTRFLSQLEIRIDGDRPLLLNAAIAEDSLQGGVELTNPDVRRNGRLVLPGRTVRLSRTFALDGRELEQRLVLESFAHEPHELWLTWHLAADFADVFEVRGLSRAHRGVFLPLERQGSGLRFAYRGLDGVVRTTEVAFEPPPERVDGGVAGYRLRLVPGRRHALVVRVRAGAGASAPTEGFAAATQRRRERLQALEQAAPRIHADHERFNQWLARSRVDFRLLLTATPAGWIPYAGIPWYVAPFGRDSLIAALQVLPFEPEVARGTLRYLARHQGAVDDPFTDQEPGKILHELRRGELAACREIPFVPYYGSVDATPLFLVLLAETLRWTGDRALAQELWPAALRALDWLRRTTDADPAGFLRYRRRSPLGLEHQGWKDSRDAVMHRSGEPARPPIALVEVQGYLYAALRGAAEVAEACGEGGLAAELRARAARLRERFEAEFWMEEEGYYALALDGEGRRCEVVSSNPGHCLWAGIVSPARAGRVAARLMAEDLFTGWGIRTLSSRERLYNPMSYHNGSVWPHDTALAAVGMQRYRFAEPFLTLTTCLFEAALQFEGARLPELFCGFPRQPGYGPTRYPVACSPQAWAAGVPFQLLAALLGLEPDAAENRLTLNRPQLPPWLGALELTGLRLGASALDLRVVRGREGAAVELLRRQGDVELVVRR